MAENLHLGLDVGTTAVKAAVYDAKGTIRAMEALENKPSSDQPGWSSQSMDSLWDIAAEAIRSVCDSADAANIASVGVCAQGDGLWMLDENQEPVCDAALWNDQRANDLIAGWMDDGTTDRLSRYCRTALWAGASGAIYRWLKDNDPATATTAKHVVYCKDWINFKLTKTLTTDFTDAAIPFLDLETRQYSSEAFTMLDVDEMEAKVSSPVSSTSLNGSVTDHAAEKTGLTAGTPVAVGSIDIASMMCGMGLAKVGDICLILGTTAVVAVVTEPKPFTGPEPGATIVHPYNNNWIKVLAPLSGASALDWFTSIDQANFGGKTPADIAQRLNAAASSVPPGANGVLFLPFLSGERAPIVVPHATASFLGVTASTTQADLARAVMEGAAMSLRHCFESVGAAKPGQIVLTGGGARNKLWCDIVASVMNTTIVASDASDHGVWGAAIIGACAAGLVNVSQPPVREEEIRFHEPDPNAVRVYERLFELYEKSVVASAPIWDARRDVLGGLE